MKPKYFYHFQVHLITTDEAKLGKEHVSDVRPPGVGTGLCHFAVTAIFLNCLHLCFYLFKMSIIIAFLSQS